MHFALPYIHCLVWIFALWPTAITSLFTATKSQFLLYLIEIPPCFFTHAQQKVTGIVLPAPQKNHACLAHWQLSKLSFHPVLRVLNLYLLFWCKTQIWFKKDRSWAYTVVTALGKVQLEISSAKTDCKKWLGGENKCSLLWTRAP